MIIYDEPDKVYRATTGLVSYHRLLDFETAPSYYFDVHIAGTTPRPAPTDAMVVGTLFHCMALEESQVENRFLCVPKGTREDSPMWLGAVIQGLQPIRAQLYVQAERMMESFETNEEAMELMAGGRSEVTLRHNPYPGFPFGVQGRADRLNPTLHRIIDLKKCADLDTFEKEIINRQYYRQGAFYRDLYEMETGFPARFILIAQESESPYRCQTFELDAGLLDEGRRRNQISLAKLAEAYATNNWPRHPRGKIVRAPNWLVPDPFAAALA